jgi:hypothetical protein
MEKNMKYWTKTFFIWLTVALIVLGLRYGLYYGFDVKLEQVFFGVEQETLLIPETCSINTIGKSIGSFACPSTASGCLANVEMECTTQVSDQRVIFRGASQTNFPSQVVVDANEDGALEVYTRGQSYITCTGTPSRASTLITYFPEPYQSNYVFLYSGTLHVCDVPTGKAIKYVADGTLSTSVTPLDGESCDYTSGFIKCLGTADAYQCSQSVTGSITKLITYSGSVKKTFNTTITMKPSQTITWNGASGSTIYTVKQQTKTSACTYNKKATSTSYYACTLDTDGCGQLATVPTICPNNQLFDDGTHLCTAPTTCPMTNGTILNTNQKICKDKYTLYSCFNPPTFTITEVTKEGDICKNGVIGPAYTVTTTMNNLAGDIVVAETNSPLNINVAITGTTDNKRILVTASIVGKGISKSGYTGDTSLTAGKVLLELTTPSEGFYTLRITINHPDGTYIKDYELRVTSGLTLNLYADNPIQYDNAKIQVRLDAYKSGENKRLTDYQYEATFNGQRVNTSAVEPSGKNLILYFTLNGDGTLRIRAKGTDETGLTTDWTDYTEVTVKETTININTDFKTGICPGNVENRFTTTDSNNVLINTQNSVLVQEPLGGKMTVINPMKVSTGTYKFNYNFIEGGLYTIKVTSTSSYGTYELGDGLGEPITILSGSACGGGGGGDDPDTNWLMYIIFGVIIGVIILVVVMMKRKKK